MEDLFCFFPVDMHRVLLLALQLPKPMFVFAFEGELLPFIVIGDRFVLLALLPRRKPRTDGTVQPPCCLEGLRQCRSLPDRLNLTSGGYSDSLVPQAAGMDFCFREGHRSR